MGTSIGSSRRQTVLRRPVERRTSRVFRNRLTGGMRVPGPSQVFGESFTSTRVTHGNVTGRKIPVRGQSGQAAPRDQD